MRTGGSARGARDRPPGGTRRIRSPLVEEESSVDVLPEGRRGSPPRAPLALRTRWGVAAGEVGGALSFIAQNTWLLYFLVNIVGLPPVVAGAVFVTGRVFDAVLDPIVGDLLDRNLHRAPRLRWVRLSALPFGLSFALMWAWPLLEGPRFLWALLGLMLHSVLFTTATMAIQSLTPTLAPDYDGRTRLTGWRVGATIVCSLLAISGPPALVLATTGDSDLASSAAVGWVVMGVVIGLVAIGGYAVAALAVVEPPHTAPAVPAARMDLAVLRRIWGLRPFRSLLAVHIVVTVTIMIGNATLPFFLESVLGMGAAEQSITLGMFYLVSAFSLPLWSVVAVRVGKPRALAAGGVVYAAGVLLLAGLRPTTEALGPLALVILVAGVGLSAILVLPLAMLPDLSEFVEEATGVRREGLLYALFGFATKIAGSVGVFGSAIVASAVGYVSGQSAQAPGTQLGLTLVIGPVAAAVCLLGAVLAARSPLTRAAFEQVRERVGRA
jgi:glycoside/pentoside/hexuronide:cation symporter, GPH family